MIPHRHYPAAFESSYSSEKRKFQQPARGPPATRGPEVSVTQ
jgi:hypothetical protein